MSDVSSVTNHFSTSNESFATTISSSVDATTDTAVPLASVTGLTDGSVFVGIIDPGVEAKEQAFTGTVDTSGSQITDVVWTKGTNVVHSSGATVVDYVSGTAHNMMTKGLLVEHNQDGTHSTALVNTLKATLLAAVYPVGSIYVNAVVATNPGTMLGFGTWVAFGSGRVMAGYDAGQTEFDTAEETGGSKTHTLTEAEMPAHNHSGTTSSAGNHAHTYQHWDAAIQNAVAASDDARFIVQGLGNYATSTTGAHTHTMTTTTKGSGSAHNNLQPYITVYMWKRTA